MDEIKSPRVGDLFESNAPHPLKLATRKYAWRYVGNVAFWIQRLTGVALVGYLILHVHTIHDLQNPEKFDAALKLFGTPLFKFAEIGLLATVILTPVALVLAVLWALWLPAVQLEGLGPLAALRRSAALVRRRVVPVVLIIGTANLVVSAAGPLLGFVVLLAGNVPFVVGNAVAGITYALLSPLVGVVTAYVYADASVRSTRREREPEAVLPAEGTLARG